MQVGGRRDVLAPQLIAAERRDGDGYRIDVFLATPRGNDDFFERRRFLLRLVGAFDGRWGVIGGL